MVEKTCDFARAAGSAWQQGWQQTGKFAGILGTLGR
jgi:hypothetical protein